MSFLFDKCSKIKGLDLSLVSSLLVKRLGWEPDVVSALAEQYKAFLYLKKIHPNEPIMPSKEIDEFWHQHILDTRKYCADCKEIFGVYLHHHPELSVSKEELTRRVEITSRLIREEFPDLT